MNVEAEYVGGVFRPLEAVSDAEPGKVYSVFSEEELRGLTEEHAWLGATERSFAFWDNEEDAIYDQP